MLQPRGSGLLGTTLRYPYKVRDEEINFGDIAEVKITQSPKLVRDNATTATGRTKSNSASAMAAPLRRYFPTACN